MLKLRFSKPDIRTFLNGQITKCYFKCQIVETQSGNVLNRFSVSGQARCNPTDHQDSKLGAALAESRAKYRAYCYAQECVDEILSSMGTGDLLDLSEQMWYMRENEAKHENILLEKVTAKNQ